MDAARKLEKALSEYEKVLLVLDQSFLRCFGRVPLDQKKILVIAKEFVDGILCEQMVASEKTCAELLQLYHTYEFSDRFQVIAESQCSGAIDNYVKTGILTWEEAVEALLR